MGGATTTVSAYLYYHESLFINILRSYHTVDPVLCKSFILCITFGNIKTCYYSESKHAHWYTHAFSSWKWPAVYAKHKSKLSLPLRNHTANNKINAPIPGYVYNNLRCLCNGQIRRRDPLSRRLGGSNFARLGGNALAQAHRKITNKVRLGRMVDNWTLHIGILNCKDL